MLKSLSIKNYLLIDELSVSFNNGFTVITGETGAGKSILVGGISLILGKRADLSVNRDKSQKCIIEGVFDIGSYNLKSIFDKQELDYDTETILRREISSSGKSRAFINDSPVNLGQLSAIGSKIIDIHSQYQNLEILEDDFQFNILDIISNNNNNVLEYENLLNSYKTKKRDLDFIVDERKNLIQSIDYNRFILDEIDSSNVLNENLEDLENIQSSLSNFEEISNELNFSSQLINNEDLGISSNLLKLKNSISKISENSEKYKSILDRIISLKIETDDIAFEIDTILNSLEQNPEKLNTVIAKIDSINSLFRKHSISTVEDLVEFRDKLALKVQSTENIDQKISFLEKECLLLKDKLKEVAQKIHKNRLLVIPDFISRIENVLTDLGMKNSKFKIDLVHSDNFYKKGMDEIQFLFKANKGYDFKKIKEAASGGEMSRIMLAIKSIMANYNQLPSIIFDEIDTGVSGEISKKMGIIMKNLGSKLQTFSITHLPQIAAMGESHFKIYKSDEEGITKTMMLKLNENDRIVEIAKMLEGNNASESAFIHAKQLLN
jgi:DNA repair protein RecN (Recombination protein N)